MRKRAPSSIRNPFNVASSAIIFVIFTSILVNYIINNITTRTRTNTINRSTSSLDVVEDKFVWSEQLNDWTWSTADHDEQVRPIDPAPIHQLACIWPEDCPNQDRIINQLLLSPLTSQNKPKKRFKILLPKRESHPIGKAHFIDNNCQLSDCLITDKYNEADAVIFSNADVTIDESFISKHRSKQIWIAYLLESPPNTFDRRFPRKNRGHPHIFNWTATYRIDSDIVTPYSKFVINHESVDEYYSSLISSKHLQDETKLGIYNSCPAKHKNLINKKAAKVAWFVSNCHAKNNRLEVAQELAKYIQVDIYGKCGNLTCSKWNESDCLRMINENYKFYLAFENSNNRDYVTEKLFKNALGHNDPDHLVLPIVLGPDRENYQKLAPPQSFIHVDDFKSIELLANFLRELDRDNAKYYSYFRWKSLGRFIDSKFLCRVCALLHDNERRSRTKSYEDIQSWWLEDHRKE